MIASDPNFIAEFYVARALQFVSQQWDTKTITLGFCDCLIQLVVAEGTCKNKAHSY
jgi:hypothetical protein